MDRRNFLGGSLGAFVAAGTLAAGETAEGTPDMPSPVSPRNTKLAVRPVMTNMIHTAAWEGPCRWKAVSPAQEAASAEARFARWPKQIAARFGTRAGVEMLPPVHVTFDEKFQLAADQAAKLTADGKQADALFIAPHGASVLSFEVTRHLQKPAIIDCGLSCRTVDIAAYGRSMEQEVFVPGSDDELQRTLNILRARKVFSETRVLFPTDRGLPPAASIASVNDLDHLAKAYGIGVTQIPYKELAAEMDRTLADKAGEKVAGNMADQLIGGAQQTHIERQYVVRSLQFYHAVKRLMVRHGCNAFTIECFEFCASRLPEKWKITPCLVHTLLKDEGFASSCEGDLGALLSMRLLMSVSQKSSHLGNMFLRPGDLLAINHSASGIKLNGYDQPGLPYKLGRFVESGWGTKAVVNFTRNEEKRVTVVRIDPTATKMLVLEGHLSGMAGWEGDNLGCSVEALIKPATASAGEFARRQLDYGNHLIWVYGHYALEMHQLGTALGMEVEVVA